MVWTFLMTESLRQKSCLDYLCLSDVWHLMDLIALVGDLTLIVYYK